ncbi:hypothetical protein OG948_37820 (plasmid) [Embleya sp. NBC_00888]|uniref:hypothetical protein n=1 Tax=Embleya sp. NBC_00888 TaxID=2975960 RepID=UPI002F90FBC1|nr:hypothetical protein OG948_37820 [Embleya sp. NBC_00888]
MNGLLAELGKKLAERWLSLLVMPGALYLAVAVSAHTLGHTHPFSLHTLTTQITQWANAPAVRTAGGQVVLLAAVLAGAAVVGLAAQALGSLAEQLHLAADWRSWPAGARHMAHRATERRRKRWEAAADIWRRHREAARAARARGTRADPAARHAARAAMTRISHESPDRPTWSGDRIHAATVRLDRDHHLDLPILWPHLWLVLPDAVRSEISAVRQSLIRATTLSAWALLYLPLAVWWWPATGITAILAVTSWRRTRAVADTYATLLEAAARVHARSLAEHLGLTTAGPLTHVSGDTLTRHLIGDTRSTPPVACNRHPPRL